MSTSAQVQNLELRAMEQRNQLHQSVTELKQKVSDVRERFDIKKNVQRHILATALTLCALLVVATIPLTRSFQR